MLSLQNLDLSDIPRLFSMVVTMLIYGVVVQLRCSTVLKQVFVFSYFVETFQIRTVI